MAIQSAQVLDWRKQIEGAVVSEQRGLKLSHIHTKADLKMCILLSEDIDVREGEHEAMALWEMSSFDEIAQE